MDVPAEGIQLVARGVFADPAAPDTGPLHFHSILVPGGDVPRVAHITDWEAFRGIVVALVFSTGTRHEMLGSAVMVGPGLALGANHTMHEWVDRINAGETGVHAVGVTADGAVVWGVVYGKSIGGTDLTIMRLKLLSTVPPARTLYFATLSTRLPAIGERTIAAGFIASAPVFEQRRERTMELNGGLRVTSGPVLQYFLEGRDRVLAPYPSIEIDAPLYGGMSGGPVFDSRGYLIALNSRSPEFGPDDEPSPMLASHIYPALGETFPATDDANGPVTSLLQMAGHYAFIERPEVVTTEATETGRVSRYAQWT
jgi:Trypsin-like peptidase domain